MDANENNQSTLKVACDKRPLACVCNHTLILKAAIEIRAINSSVALGWFAGTQPANCFALQCLSKAFGISFEWLLKESGKHSGTRNLRLQDLFEEQDCGRS